MNLILANGKSVDVSQDEVSEFITQEIHPNSYWRHANLLTEEEVMKFLKRESIPEKLKKIARYLLIYIENLAFTAYLFDKAEGNPNMTKEFNIPALKKLRALYQKAINNNQSETDLYQIVNEMESVCLEIGADPL